MINLESEGEELIAEFLEDKGIKFKKQVEIKLNNDTKAFRVADFYLENYKVYIEFFGRWNIEENRLKYNQKRKIYEENKLPCIYLYPDNLGILEFLFYRRISSVLKKYNMKWELFKLNSSKFSEKYGMANLILLLLIIFFNDLTARIIFGIILIANLYLSIKKSFFLL